MSHTIQLRGPWQLTPLARTQLNAGGDTETLPDESLPSGGRLNPVGEWSPLLGDFRGVVRYERFFHRPTGLTNEPVVLVVEPVSWRGEAALNDACLGTLAEGQPLRVDIREQLDGRNRLRLDLEHPAGLVADNEPGLIGGVWLEIG